MNKLFELRSEKSLSQREIAKQFDVSQGTYNNWENSNTEPSIDQLIALSKFFGVSIDYIVENCDDFGQGFATKAFAAPDELNLLESYRKLPINAKKALADFLQALEK